MLTTRFEELKMSEDESFDSFYGKLNGFLGFSRLSLAIGLQVEAPIVSFTQTVWWLSSQLSHRWNFQSRKTLIQIFQIFSHGFLATWIGDLFVTYYSHEKRMFCTLRVIFRAVFKNFSFFPRISWLFIILFAPPSAKINVFTHKHYILFIISSSIFEKRYGFCLFLNVFHVSSLRFLGFCVCVEIWKYDDWIWFTDVLLSLLYGFCWLCVFPLFPRVHMV